MTIEITRRRSFAVAAGAALAAPSLARAQAQRTLTVGVVPTR